MTKLTVTLTQGEFMALAHAVASAEVLDEEAVGEGVEWEFERRRRLNRDKGWKKLNTAYYAAEGRTPR